LRSPSSVGLRSESASVVGGVADPHPMHFRGRVKPAKPPCTTMDVGCRQFLQIRFSRAAREARTEAETTMPGMRTSLEMRVACTSLKH
jgi:hypothetical protein